MCQRQNSQRQHSSPSLMSLSTLPLAPILFPPHCLLVFHIFSLLSLFYASFPPCFSLVFVTFNHFIPSLLLFISPYMLSLYLLYIWLPLSPSWDTKTPPPYSFLLFSLPSPSPLFTVIGCLLLLSLLPSSLPCSLPCCCVCQCSSCSSRGRRRLSCKPKLTLAIITELASNLC